MASCVVKGEKYKMINFEETELRLGLPGESTTVKSTCNISGKRGFSDTNTAMDLKLNLSSSNVSVDKIKDNITTTAKPSHPSDPAKPPSKAQVVGWPPVRSYRRNIVNNVQRSNNNEIEKKATTIITKTATATATTNIGVNNSIGAFVKVSMDGAPYLRKVDLKLYNSYQELSDAVAKMFSSFTIEKCGSQGMKDFMNENKLIDILNDSDYVSTYEDKDGDWMLVGDVPWEMFVQSCMRLRIMKGSEAIGLAPRAVEKCKNRS
ncbi:hypothetical protein Lal_00048949 [Lupinus albus]|uniref:Auxin-induced protein n=1 Tax=Lupinus albus TaxID=3870 RepID=A0A6A5N9S8_LUPAL|nr:putative transcription factor interactor and regulator AUX-IAA family [Lupinus albus]KAF1880313.1 hypothetical protein Lal_00048949 [Lupinus albus]